MNRYFFLCFFMGCFFCSNFIRAEGFDEDVFLNDTIFNQLKDKGSFDAQGKKIGDWVEYTMQVEAGTEEFAVCSDSLGKYIDFRGLTLMRYSGRYSKGYRGGEWLCFAAKKPLKGLSWFVRSRVNYAHGKKNGWEKYFSPDSVMLTKTWYNNGVRDSVSVSYYPSGHVNLYVNYKNDKQNGALISYFEDGVIESEKHYKEDSLHGKSSFYDDQGVLLYERFFDMGNQINTKFYKNDVVVEEGVFVDFKPHGEYKAYYESGVLKEQANFVFGVSNGERVLYYPSGSVKEKSVTKNGKYNGKMISYYENGNIQSVAIYKEGKLDGIWEFFHENGQSWTKINFVDGKPWDVLNNYNEKGNKQQKGNLQNGNGTIYRYSPEGKLLEINHYKKGVLVDSEKR